MGIVAKYKFDHNIYENLVPEFNPEFTDYTITDELGGKTNIFNGWTTGGVSHETGEEVNDSSLVRSNYLNVAPNTNYTSTATIHIIWYDTNKNYISYDDTLVTYIENRITTSPQNARYMRVYRGSSVDITIASATDNITIRTIESDSLPTLMRFGRFYTPEDPEVQGLPVHNCLLEVISLDTSELTDMTNMFRSCIKLTSIITDNWDTRKVTSLCGIFNHCYALKSVDLSYLNTDKVTDIRSLVKDSSVVSVSMRNCNTNSVVMISSMFDACTSLTTLDISNCNFIIDNIIETNYTMFSRNTSLKYIKCNMPLTIQMISSLLPTRASDNKGVIIYQGEETLPSETISTLSSKNWTVVSEVELIAEYKYDSKMYKNLIPEFNDGYMGFITDEDIDENGIVTRKIEHIELPTEMRFGDAALDHNVHPERASSLLEILYLNTNNLNTMICMFDHCFNLNSINTDGWNTNKVINMTCTFNYCKSLTTLDVSCFNINQATSVEGMFSGSDNLALVDISNFIINSTTRTDYIFAGLPKLTDIGMIYCNKDTVNKVALLLSADVHRTIWVGEHDLSQYDQYDHITYKTQIVEEEVILNSPLLEGDRIEVVDGKLCHYHKMGMVVLDGSNDENWELNGNQDGILSCISHLVIGKIGTSVRSALFLPHNFDNRFTGEGIRLSNTTGKLIIEIYLSKLPTQDVGGFKQWLKENPTTVVYELANPYYEILQDKPLSLTLVSEEDNDISNSSNIPTNMIVDNRPLPTIGMGGSKEYTIAFDKSDEESSVVVNLCGSSIETTDNIVHITTPSTIENNELTILGNGEEISNVRILEGNVVDKGIPKESFEGLKNSFEDGLLPSKNLLGFVEPKEVKPGTTNIIDIPMTNIKPNTYYTIIAPKLVGNYVAMRFRDSVNNIPLSSSPNEQKGFVSPYLIKTVDETYNFANNVIFRLYSLDEIDNPLTYMTSDVILLEGDWTHLTEEDFNHLGQYKVEYKVTGKNKWRTDLLESFKMEEGRYYSSSHYTLKELCPDLIEGKQYKVSFKYDTTNYKDGAICVALIPYLNISNNFFTYTKDMDDMEVYFYGGNLYNTFTNIQLEEGTQATPYEPYKGQIKTFYLNSPLLEGDTIEDVNGVATHVHRMGKVVLNGSEDWNKDPDSNNCINVYKGQDGVKRYTQIYCNNFIYESNYNYTKDKECIGCNMSEVLNLSINKSKLSTPDVNGIKQWLQANPTTVVYELAEPWYEPIGAYGKVVLDGSEDWARYDTYTSTTVFYSKIIHGMGAIGTNLYSNRFTSHYNAWDVTKGIEGILMDPDISLTIQINNSKLATLDADGFKQWLRENPTTVIYKLITPQYQGSTLCDSYVNGHLDLDSAVPVEKVVFNGVWLNPKYIQPATKYIIQFEADNDGFIDCISFCWVTLSNIKVSKGINRVFVTSPVTIQHKCCDFYGIGFNASNIQVVQADEDIEFDYFEGLSSSFEDSFSGDTNIVLYKNEGIENNNFKIDIASDNVNYYAINNFEGALHPSNVFWFDGFKKDSTYTLAFNSNAEFDVGISYHDNIGSWNEKNEYQYRVKVGENKLQFKSPKESKYCVFRILNNPNNCRNFEFTNITILDKYKVECKVEGKNKFDGEWEKGVITSIGGVNSSSENHIRTIGYIPVRPNTSYIISTDLNYGINTVMYDKNKNFIITYNVPSFTTPSNCYYVRFRTSIAEINTSVKLQIEEGTQVTSYEPYKSYTKTFYLNSPLLQGDTIEEVNGKLCHVHRMGMVTLDGSEIWEGSQENGYWTVFNSMKRSNNYTFDMLCDRLPVAAYQVSTTDCIAGYALSSDYPEENWIYIHKKDKSSVDEFKQWLQTNPTTAIYQLSEPWYEPIEPEQQNLTITSIKDADLHIDTVVPISSTVTYNVNVKLLTDFEESIISQVQNANEVNLLSILDEEIDN